MKKESAEKKHRYRAKMIAQTEMAKTYNYGAEEAAVQTYERGLLDGIYYIVGEVIL